MGEKLDSEAVVREIRRKTRKKYSSEEKIRTVLEGLRSSFPHGFSGQILESETGEDGYHREQTHSYFGTKLDI
jgi:hypothetical protein